MIAPWHHKPKRNRGKLHPRTYDVTVQYERDQIDFEDAARRLGQLDMGAFFVLAARITCWLLTEWGCRDEEAEARKEQDRLDQVEREHQARRERARRDRESRVYAEREEALHRLVATLGK